jgi:undecaprenyl-diphosphatase
MQAAFWVLAVGGTALLNMLAKHVFARVRPDFWVSLLPETTFSFPSGHAMHSMAVVAALVALTWHSRWRWLVALIGVCFVFLVGLSRIYLGVHFPSDILAGWTASLTWVIGLSFLFRDVWQQRRRSGTSVAAKFD